MKKKKVYILIGLPASGKSSWARDNAARTDATVIINNDAIRAAIYAERGNSVWSSKVEDEVGIRRAEAIAGAALNPGVNALIIDNTHLNPKTLKATENYCSSFGMEIEHVDFRHVSVDECIRRDSIRPLDERVGEAVIRKMAKFMTTTNDRNLPVWKPIMHDNCLIVDIDGTLAKMKDRGPYDESLVYNDDVRLHVLWTIQAIVAKFLPENIKLFIFTGRSEKCRFETVRWLTDKCGLDHSKYTLVMRGATDRRKDSLVKLDMYTEHVKDKYSVFVVFDDRASVIRDCWKPLALPIFNCGIIDVEF